MNLLPPLLIILVISSAVSLLLKLDRISQRNRSSYTRPVICNEEYIFGCSGGHVVDLRRTWTTASVYTRPVITHQAIEVEADQPIEVPNWPVKVVKQ